VASANISRAGHDEGRPCAAHPEAYASAMPAAVSSSRLADAPLDTCPQSLHLRAVRLMCGRWTKSRNVWT